MQIDASIPAEQPPKKRPGRPKKPITSFTTEMRGVVPNPANEEDLLELMYCNPSLFKKILQLYKQYEVGDIDMNFTPDGVKIESTDHLGKTTIYVDIAGKFMNFYYCKAPIHVCVKIDSLEKVFRSLNKNHYKITFILKSNYRSTMYLMIGDHEYMSEDTYSIDVICKTDVAPTLPVYDDADYPIKFRMNSKHFKTRINQIRGLSTAFNIQKCGSDPLQFTFDGDQKINWIGVYNNSEAIDLKCTLQPNDIFSASIPIDYIRPFAAGVIGNDVYIAADKHKKMSFTTLLDEIKGCGYVAQVKVFIEIKDYGGGQQPQ